jgi:hypothetical protein
MSDPRLGDVLIRRFASAYLITDAVTGKMLANRCGTLAEASLAAAELSHGCRVWQENVDQRGRSLGPPVLLPIRALPHR